MSTKVAIIVFADSETRADMGRISNAVEITNEFHEEEDEAKLLFDVAGVTWPGKLSNPEHPLHQSFKKVKPHILGACAFCSKAFKAEKGVKKSTVPFLEDYNGNPSVHGLVKQGYQIITVKTDLGKYMINYPELHFCGCSSIFCIAWMYVKIWQFKAADSNGISKKPLTIIKKERR